MDRVTLQHWATEPIADYIVALGNTNGGTVLFPSAEATIVERVLQPIIAAIRPSIEVSLQVINNSVEVDVPRGNEVYALPDGRVMGWFNEGPRRLDGEQIRRLITARTHDNFEATLVPSGDFTVADALTTQASPQKWLPQAVIVVAAYDSNFCYRQETFAGTVSQQYNDCLAVMMDILTDHRGVPRFPIALVGELLVNALAHRDYRQKQPIDIAMHLHKIEFTVPGVMPGFATPAILFEQHYHRNPKLVGYFVDMGLMQGQGNGGHHFHRWQQDGTENAWHIETPNPALLHITIEYIATMPLVALNWRQDKAMTYIRQHGSLTLRIFRVLCADETLERLEQDLAELVAAGLVQSVGSGQKAVYIQRT